MLRHFVLHVLEICKVHKFHILIFNITIVRQLGKRSPFLLDNNIQPANNLNFTYIYESRKRCANNGCYPLTWDDRGHRLSTEPTKPYWKLENINDLINQYNFVGYHDICNYPLLDRVCQFSKKKQGINFFGYIYLEVC